MPEQRRTNFIVGTSATYLFNAVNIIFGIISVPIGLKYFGVERYGALAIINTLIAYLSISNFGIPQTASILAAKALDKLEQMKIIIKSFILMAIIVFLVSAILLFFSRNSSWINILGRIPKPIYREVSRVALIAALLFLINLPFTVFSCAFTAVQKVHIARIYDVLAVISSFTVLMITVSLGKGIIFYMFITGTLKILISLICALHFIFLNRRDRFIFLGGFNKLLSVSPIDEFSLKSILITGWRFFLGGIAATVVWHTDNLVISNFIGLKAVAPYAVTFRLITVSFVIFTTLNVALNPMYGRAFSKGEYGWIEHVYNKITQVQQFLGGFVWIASIAFAKEIINLWTGPSGYAGLLTVFALGGYGYSLSLVHTHSGLITSLNLIKNIVYIGWCEALANLFFSILLVRYLGIGGVALGTFLAALTTVFWMVPFEIKRRSGGKIRFEFGIVIKNLLQIILPFVMGALFVYLFVANDALKIVFNAILLFIYTVVSYKRLPKETRDIWGQFYKKYSPNGTFWCKPGLEGGY
jgi:O-antigen/teichoic acid export membrane protein